MSPEKKSLSNQHIFDIVTKIMLADDVNVVITNDSEITTSGCADQDNGILYVSQLISEQDHLMPGLVIHEIAHFKYTPNEPIDLILNIVEDGYIERRVSRDYLGAKKFLRILFDDLIEKNFKVGEEQHVQLLNTLIFNTKGIKYGKRKKYPPFLTNYELEIFEKAEIIDGDFNARKRISDSVRKIIKKYTPKEDDKNTSDSDQKSDNQNNIDDENKQSNPDNFSSTITFNDDEEEAVEQDNKLLNEALQKNELIDYGKYLSFDKSDDKMYSIPSHQWIVNNVDLIQVSAYDHVLDVPKNVYLGKLLKSKKISQQLFSMFMSRVTVKNYSTEKYMQSRANRCSPIALLSSHGRDIPIRSTSGKSTEPFFYDSTRLVLFYDHFCATAI